MGHTRKRKEKKFESTGGADLDVRAGAAGDLRVTAPGAVQLDQVADATQSAVRGMQSPKP